MNTGINKKIKYTLLIILTVACLITGCTGTEAPEILPDPSASLTDTPVTDPAKDPEVNNISNPVKDKEDEPSKPTEPAYESETLDMDVISILEYDRSRIIANADYYDSLDNSNKQTWCFKRMKDHSPSGTYEEFKIADYDGYYYNDKVKDGDKVMYFTFDCGYPSNLTVKILDTLAKHNVKATFFVTKMYLEKCSDYAKRMKEEGHMVCNHTVTHTDLRTKSVEEIAAEIYDVAEYFYETTGYEFDPYFRTPTGTYTPRLMTILKDAGYKTVFWSIAYGDYDPNNQPAPGYVTEHFRTYHHNGAIALMHNDSPSNADELDAVLTLLENEGYRFGLLDELE